MGYLSLLSKDSPRPRFFVAESLDPLLVANLFTQDKGENDAWPNPLNSHNILSVTASGLVEDVEEATDYVIRVGVGTIGARIRQDHITFRDLTLGALHKDRKGRTELDKVLDGDPRWYLYCWTKKDRISEWMFLDVEVLVKSPIINLNQRRQRFVYDGKRAFVSVSIQELAEAGALLRYEKSLVE